MVDDAARRRRLHTLGGFFRRLRAEYVTPIRASYRGYDVWECPPNGQGLVPLVMLNALEGFDLSRWGPDSVELCHALVEIGRQAYADRDCFIGDPRTGDVPVAKHFCPRRTPRRCARRVSRSSSAMDDLCRSRSQRIATRPSWRSSIADRNTVAFINSIFDDFGCGIVSPTSGVIFHNRACGLCWSAVTPTPSRDASGRSTPSFRRC